MKETKKFDMACLFKKYEIVGAIFIIIATWMALMTLNSGGILGMFLVGLALCCKRKMGCRCACHQKECEDDMTCCMGKKEEPVMKKPAVKKPKNVAS